MELLDVSFDSQVTAEAVEQWESEYPHVSIKKSRI